MKTLLLATVATMVSATMMTGTSWAATIGEGRYHLGVAGQPEWQEFADSTPHGPQLELKFNATATAGEATLFIRQSNVKIGWNVAINGQRIGTLETLTQPLVRALPVRAGLLRDGENTLTIARGASRLADDIVVSEITLELRPRAEVLGAATLAIAVTDAEGGSALPCRLTLVDEREALMPVQPAEGQQLAVRTGVIYTGDGRAELGVAPGTYLLYAGRGFEYSVATQRVTVAAGETKAVALSIRREVPTPGLVACDTHIHTLTYSKHGDATVDERLLTIAGEGIELAVATDHNHHADYTEAVERMGMNGHFRSVIGNEISTKAGHFNAFPMRADSPLPDAQLTDWMALLHNIRSVTGAKVVTLNHPRDVHQNFTPFAAENFDPVTGELRAAPKFDVDAIEVVTSAAMQSDIMLLYRDWFALLNYGYRVAAIGASDTHQVSEFILGQSRTYAAVVHDNEPGSLDVDEVCASYRAGRLLVSMGLLTQMAVNGKVGVGEVATGLGDEVNVEVTVHGPSWVTADRVELFANGIKVRE
ncbi:MAG: CehA/McbA family metallohydrolase, partial [Verrucomicrobiota bacterium]